MADIRRWTAREVANTMAQSTGKRSRQSGGSWVCYCPAHKKEDALSCRDTTDKDGNAIILFNCFAKCDFISIVRGLREHGIDIPPTKPRKKGWVAAPATAPAVVAPPKPDEYVYAPERAGERPFQKNEIAKIASTLTTIYNWYDDHGRIVFHSVRIVNRFGRKKVLPVTPWTEIATGKLHWLLKGPVGPQPLYNTPADKGQATVLVVEGEKTANAAIRLMSGTEIWVTTTHGGTSAPARTLWTRLRGRKVIIAHDLDPAGLTYAAAVTAAARENDAASVHLWTVPTSHIVEGGCLTPRSTPYKKGYDLADSIEDGWTLSRLARLQQPWYGPEVTLRP